ncbi:ABC transporter permease, partial [Leucobacter sp. M11]|uniref:ABC transporter permease n=1 Tax=Leucobacter sp. M11 TaxID=2993565 RepID=UPI002D80EB9B
VTIGMAQTASGQISKQFDALAATQVVIEPGSSKQGEKERATARIPWDAVTRVEGLVGVERAALFANVDIGSDTVAAVSVYDPAEAKQAPPKVMAGTGELMKVVNGTLDTGRFFDEGHDARGDRVVVLGAKAAKRLGVNRVSDQPAVFIGDKAYTVIGILGKTEARPALLDAVILPMGTARGDFSVSKPESLDIRIAIGAGPVVGKQAPIALDPNAPENFKVKAPATASDLQGSVQEDINVVFLALGVIALLAGGLGIANVTLLSVMERGGEIGLRRALGATKRQIAQQFMLESVVTGVLGGLIGAAVGVFTIVIISLVQGWTPVLALWVPL